MIPCNNVYVQSLIIYYHRTVLDENRQITKLGDAREFFDNFQWTDQAARDIEAVNLKGIHVVGCGSEVLHSMYLIPCK